MEDIQEQLAQLRRRIARIDRKWTGSESAGSSSRREAAPRPGLTPQDLPLQIEQLMSGEVVRTAHGEHFETGRLWERHRRHGSVDISDLAELPADLLRPLAIAIIGALVISLLLSLVVTPVFYYVMMRLLRLDKPLQAPTTAISESDGQPHGKSDGKSDGQPHGVIHAQV